MSSEIWFALQLVGTVIVGVCFGLSGITKLRDGKATANTFAALRVPAALNWTWIHAIYPWAELVLGLGVLVAPGPVWWLFAATATAMLLALCFLVARVLHRAERVSCNCFGSKQPVTGRTLTRNLILLSVSALVLLSPLTAPSPLLQALAAQFPLLLAVLASCMAGVALTTLSYDNTLVEETNPTGVAAQELPEQVPPLHLLDSQGASLFLPVLVRDNPTLLVSVKEGCASCEATTGYFQDKHRIANRVAVRMIERTPPSGPAAERERLWDYEGELAQSLGLRTSPAAILIAAGGTIATTPVYGFNEIVKLVRGIEQATREHLTRPDPGQS